MPDDLLEVLTRVLGEIRRRGGIGTQPVAEAIQHSERFVRACPADTLVAADLGSGGGLPGLVLAARRPDIEWHLIERRGTRVDLLRYGVRALDLGDRVHVHDEDVAGFTRRRIPVDLVTARSFAPLAETVVAAGRLLRSLSSIGDGRSRWLLVSEPPMPASVDSRLLGELQLVDRGTLDGIRRFERTPG